MRFKGNRFYTWFKRIIGLQLWLNTLGSLEEEQKRLVPREKAACACVVNSGVYRYGFYVTFFIPQIFALNSLLHSRHYFSIYVHIEIGTCVSYSWVVQPRVTQSRKYGNNDMVRESYNWLAVSYCYWNVRVD